MPSSRASLTWWRLSDGSSAWEVMTCGIMGLFAVFSIVSARGKDSAWKRWSSSSGTGVLYLVWHLSERGESLMVTVDLRILDVVRYKSE